MIQNTLPRGNRLFCCKVRQRSDLGFRPEVGLYLTHGSFAYKLNKRRKDSESRVKVRVVLHMADKIQLNRPRYK